MIQYIQKTPNYNNHHVNAEKQQEQEKEAIVPSPNAVVHPRTVMVKVLRTVNTEENILILQFISY